MRTEFLCISVLRAASGPRVKLASCKSALNPSVVYFTDRSKAVVLVLFLLFVALWFLHCFLFFFFLFFFVFLLLFFFVCFFFLFCFFVLYICCDASIVVTVFNSCPLCFLFY